MVLFRSFAIRCTFLHFLCCFSLFLLIGADLRSISITDLLASNRGSVYFDPRTGNYSKLLELSQLKSIYMIANGNKLIRLNSETMRPMSTFELPSRPSSSVCLGNPEAVCQENVAFTLLARTADEQNIWYCYVYQTEYLRNTIIPNVDSARCEIPDPITLEPDARLVQWENSVYSSMDLTKNNVHLMSDDGFLYTAGWFHSSFHIHRTMLPNYDGLPNWDGFLTTPIDEEYFRGEVVFVAAFETDDQVYFLYRESEPRACLRKLLTRESVAANLKQTWSPVTRLARVCKGDPGGYPHVNAGEFVTFAKATVECKSSRPVGDWNNGKSAVEPSDYVKAVSAYWDHVDGNLYVIFTSQERASSGSALCVYSKSAMQEAFEGDLVKMDENGKKESVKNTLRNMCEKFKSGRMTGRDLEEFRRTSKLHITRSQVIRPNNHQAIITQHDPSDSPWNTIFLDHVGEKRIIYLSSSKSVERYRLFKSARSGKIVACQLDRFQLGSGTFVGDVIRSIVPSTLAPFTQFYVLTSRHVLRLPFSGIGCGQFTTKSNCTHHTNVYCQWNERMNSCEDATMIKLNGPSVFSDYLNDLSQCEQIQQTSNVDSLHQWWALLSEAGHAEQMREQISSAIVLIQPTKTNNLTCWARPCLDCSSDSAHSLQLTNCSIQPQWSPWSDWSSCPVICGFGVRTRTRKCDSPAPALIWGSNGQQMRSHCHVDDLSETYDEEVTVSKEQLQLQSCSMYPICKEAAVNPVRGESSGVDYFWDQWTTCSNDCGMGLTKRHRRCRSLYGRISQTQQLTSCAVIGPGKVESRLCYSDVCPGSTVYSDWTEWLQPLDNSMSMDGLVPGRRIRFSCSSSHHKTPHMRVGQLVRADRKCTRSRSTCTPITGIDVPSLHANPVSTVQVEKTSPRWSIWTECPQVCVHPESITGSAQVNHEGVVSLYTHSHIQTRYQLCDHSGGCTAGRREVRNCPPLPACTTGWSCWSSWSRCTARRDKRSTVCKGDRDGLRSRHRICVERQSDWLAARSSSCDGPANETESCPFAIGLNCMRDINATWSEWSSWSACSSSPEQQPMDGTQSLAVENLVRTRQRKCIPTIDVGISDGQMVIDYGTCLGPWQEKQTCITGALLKASVMREYAEALTWMHLIIIGCVAFLIGVLVTVIGIVFYRRHSEGFGGDVKMNKQSCNTLFDHSNINRIYGGSSEQTPLIITGPPQPILSLPAAVNNDMLISREGDMNYPLQTTVPTVYDSVASQDFPTSPGFHEDSYTSEPREAENVAHFVHHQLAETNWTTSRSSKNDKRSFSGDNSQYRASFAKENAALNMPYETQGNIPLPPYEDYDNQSVEYNGFHKLKDRTKSLSPHSQLDISQGNPSYSPERENSITRSIENFLARTSPNEDMEPNTPEIEPRQRHRLNPDEENLSYQITSRFSCDSSNRFIGRRDSAFSDVYSICLERPQNPHLRDLIDDNSSVSNDHVNCENQRNGGS